ncbi:MAG: TIGR04282 family arsenosugar biosynthesis glycosyltransferase [Candidatus Saccharibacteria bacterium]|nr:TIGR04282 family arsenosugar biosynthesis glycosyltransferase [Moraxellaceae bacterium]
MTDKVRLVIFAKYPKVGQVKTRLIPAIGAEGAVKLANLMLRHTLDQALQSQVGEIELCVSPDSNSYEWQSIHLTQNIYLTDQGNGNLGQRLTRAAQRVVEEGKAVIFIGTDCPALNAAMLKEVVIQLEKYDAVMIPASDGGYVLLALKHFDHSVFMDIQWSTSSVASDSLTKIKALGWSVTLLPVLHDIDEPEDLNKLPLEWLAKISLRAN